HAQRLDHVIGLSVGFPFASRSQEISKRFPLHEHRATRHSGAIEHMPGPLPLVLMELQGSIVMIVSMTRGEHGDRHCKSEEAVSDHAQKIIHFTKGRYFRSE